MHTLMHICTSAYSFHEYPLSSPTSGQSRAALVAEGITVPRLWTQSHRASPQSPGACRRAHGAHLVAEEDSCSPTHLTIDLSQRGGTQQEAKKPWEGRVGPPGRLRGCFPIGQTCALQHSALASSPIPTETPNLPGTSLNTASRNCSNVLTCLGGAPP